jgi:N-sulfoglucosamine sulfohydrolase
VLNRAGYETGITQKFHLSPVWKFPFDQFIVQHLEPEDTYGAVKQFIEAAGDRPSFLMCNIGNTHRPFKRVDPEGTGIEPVDPDAIEVPGHLPDTPRMRRDLANYFDTVQVADACLGRGMDALREAGRLEDTLIIFSADQGYAYHRAKATAYDDGTHVPLIVSGPGIERGIESEQLVSHVDVMPTILDYLGVGIPETVQGRTLRPLLNGERPDDWRDIVFTEHNSHGPNIEREWYPIRSAYDGRLHYLWNLASERVSEKPMQAYIDEADPPEHAPPVPWTPQDCFPGGPWDNQSFVATVEAKDAFPLQFELLQQTFARPEEELYDHHSDPDELFNVASDPAYAEHRARLRKALEDWMDATRDAGYDLKDVPRREG